MNTTAHDEQVRVRLVDGAIVTRKAMRSRFRDRQLDLMTALPESDDDAVRLRGGRILDVPAVQHMSVKELPAAVVPPRLG